MAVEPRIGALIGGRYRLEHLVGEGGMGSVWVAEDEKLTRWVAVKLMGERATASKSAAERFQREAKAIARLRSPHVVQVFDYGIDRTRPYLVMELLHGEDLRGWLRRSRPVPLAAVARIVEQVAKALAAMHRAGIVHRDLKPTNVFVVRDHDEDVVKVFDFGLAKGAGDLALLGDKTADGVLLGTPRYMSPEQAHGARKVDHRSDLWSLAVIAYLAVTGRLPFRGLGVGEVITKISTEPHPPPSTFVPGLAPAVDAFFARALAKDPEARYPNATALARAFVAVARDGVTSGELDLPGEADTVLDPTEDGVVALDAGGAGAAGGTGAPATRPDVRDSLPARSSRRPTGPRVYWSLLVASAAAFALVAALGAGDARSSKGVERFGPAVAAIVNGALVGVAAPSASSAPLGVPVAPEVAAEIAPVTVSARGERATASSAEPEAPAEVVSAPDVPERESGSGGALPADRGLGEFSDRH